MVTQMDTTSLDEEDIRKIDRMVMNTRGDLLYARSLVLFEGETEEQAFPFFAEKYWQRQPNALGITFIGVGGSGNYLPFLRLATSFEIPWYIFSDGETNAIRDLKKALSQIGVLDYEQHPNVFVLPNNNNFESYLVAEKYEDAITTMLDSYHEVTNYLDNKYIPLMDGQQKKKSTVRDYRSQGGREQALLDVLLENKTKYAKPLAASITALVDKKRRFPDELLKLFDQISKNLSLEKGE